ncbi:ABC transporter substrate-binding protein [Acidovorax sp. SUPP2825]|uniref:ABC transporter substrate-binding protein n=1 Tax=Acidovorax sp. SUPP2825 TaxID=2920879 RepID=UPI0023DE4A03|nr:ABC transporter substrate-binding protein [Acidovorax sp. SUPP2825]GKS96735.1 ABC transporter substrate-binding protein [Acidovorax sp. SUPP2825]
MRSDAPVPQGQGSRRALLRAWGAAGAAGIAGAAWLPGRAPAQAREATAITDDLGRSVSVSLPLRRVVVFNRYTTEFIRAIGAMPAVVGVDFDGSKHPDYWPGVTSGMLAGSGQSSVHYEAIVGMQADAVFMPRNSDWKQAERVLKPFGIPVIVVTGWDLLKHEWNVALLGRLFHRTEGAARLNAFYRHWRDTLRDRLQGATPRRVYFEEVGPYKTVLQGSGWHDMIEAGGGTNVFGDIRLPGGVSPRGNVQNFEVDPEEVAARRPEVVVKLQPGQYLPHPRAFSADVLGQLAARPGWEGTPAVRHRQIHHLSYYLASGCSKITGALQIAQWLHPGRMAGIDPEAVMGTWLQTFQGVPAQRGYAWSLDRMKGGE